MGFGPFSSESTTKQTQTDSRVAATDQAVVFQPRLGGRNARYIAGNNQPVNIRVGQKGSYTVSNTNTYGIGKDDLEALLTKNNSSINETLSSFGTQLTGIVGSNRDEGGIDDAVNRAVGDRLDKQITAGGETAAENASPGLSKQNWILIGVGVFLLIAAIAFRRRHR
jgi:hypothetical protein